VRKARAMLARTSRRATIPGDSFRFLPLAATIALVCHLIAAASAPFTSIAPEARAGRLGDIAAVAVAGSDMLGAPLLAARIQEPGEVEPSPTLEFVRQMTALDVLFIMLWVGAIILGIATGVIRQLMLIISLIIGALIAAGLAIPLSHWTGPFTGTNRESALPATYAVLVVLSVALVYFFSTRVYPETRLGQYLVIDRVGGAILGFVTGLIAVAILVGVVAVLTSQEWAVLDSTRTNMRAQLTTTPFLPLVATTFPLVTESVANILPLPMRDLCAHCLAPPAA
jgi:uncharacterized membrane protein required for colicin V production